MDPNACFERFVNAVCDGDREESEAALDDLKDWYRHGGVDAKFPTFDVSFLFVRNLSAMLSR